MNKIVVHNKHHGKYKGEGDWTERNIMQSHGSVLGNPYYREKREVAITLFHAYFIDEMAKIGSPINTMVNKLAKHVANGTTLVLVCVCAPKMCHGDIIKDAITEIIKRDY